MSAHFSLRALGKGSIASWIKTALEVLWWALWLAAAILVLTIVSYIAVLVLTATGVLSPALLEPGESTRHIGPITIQTSSDEKLIWPLVAPAFLAGVVAIGGSLLIVQRLRRLFKSFTSGKPFSRDNAGNLSVIWITMLVMELSRYAIAATTSGLIAIFGLPAQTQVHVENPVNFMTWGAILILIVLAEVFREGARLQQEQELTI